MRLLVLLALSACAASKPSPAPGTGGTAQAPPPPAEPVTLDRDYPRLAERATQLYRDVAGVFASAGNNCPAATEKLGELQRAYADVVAANAKVLRDGRARELRAALVPHEQELDASAKAIVESPTMESCSQDIAFNDAFDNLVGAPP
ncbi:MAG TPA: hypothetical protein VM513_00350 [Kofleriaceae bacterium]|nr:hypothetical protein [Kofleriaceae bacterium]